MFTFKLTGGGCLMTEESRKQQYGRAYILALAAHAGVNHAIPDNDLGVDGQFRGTTYNSVRHRYMDDSSAIDYQLKSTVNAVFENGFIKYDLEIKNYQDLILDRIMPMILILYVMPRNENEWLQVSPEKTEMKRCAWWCFLQGYPDTNNKETIRISIPVNQVLTPNVLNELLNKVRRGESL